MGNATDAVVDRARFVVFVKQLGTNQWMPFFFDYEWAALDFAAETGGVLFRK